MKVKYKPALSKLQNLINAEYSHSDVAKDLEEFGIVVSANALSNRFSNDGYLKEEEAKILENKYNISLSSNENSDSITLDYFPDVCGSCGNGVFEFSTKKTLMSVPKESFMSNVSPSKQYFVVNAYGNSMEPLIHNKDKLIIEKWNGEQIIDNSPYLFCYHDEIFIKRLVKNVDQLVIISDNKDYDTRKLTGNEMNEVGIIGKVVGLLMREF